MKEFDRFIDIYNNAAGGAAFTSDELAAVATAVEYLGANDPQLFKDALKAYDRAVVADPFNTAARDRLGEALSALVQLRRRASDVRRGARATPNPSSASVAPGGGAPASGRRPARRRLDIVARGPQHQSGIRRSADAARRDDVGSRGVRGGANGYRSRAAGEIQLTNIALAVATAIQVFDAAIKPASRAMKQRALAINPSDADLYGTLGELAAQVRLYSAAADFCKAGRGARSEELARLERCSD